MTLQQTSPEEERRRVSHQAPLDPAAIPRTFGGNEWLIQELYERYRKDPDLVNPAWWDFFEDYGRAAPSDGPAPRDVTAPAVTTPGAQRGDSAAGAQRGDARAEASGPDAEHGTCLLYTSDAADDSIRV